MADQQARANSLRVSAYDRRFVALHWLLALLIVATSSIGLVMVELRFSPLRLRLFNWHKWLGIAILALSLARFGWRLVTPRLAAAAPGHARVATRRGARNPLRVLRSVPVRALSGWLYTSAVGVPVVWLGWLPLPDLVPLTSRSEKTC